MGISVGSPKPPHITDPALMIAGLVIWSVAIFGITILVDIFGTAMFRRGVAKPFYLRGRRIHHDCIYLIIPAAFAVFAALFLLGYIQFVHNTFWLRIGATGVLTGICIALDFIGDKFWPEIRKNVVLHHEWLYSLIPLYILTNVIVVTV